MCCHCQLLHNNAISNSVFFMTGFGSPITMISVPELKAIFAISFISPVFKSFKSSTDRMIPAIIIPLSAAMVSFGLYESFFNMFIFCQCQAQ